MEKCESMPIDCALLSIICYELADDLHRIICGVIKELDLQPVARVIQRADSFHEPNDNVALVVDRQLNRDAREVVFPGGSFKILENVSIFLLAFAAITAKKQEQDIAVGAVEKEPAEAQEVERGETVIGNRF